MEARVPVAPGFDEVRSLIRVAVIVGIVGLMIWYEGHANVFSR